MDWITATLLLAAIFLFWEGLSTLRRPKQPFHMLCFGLLTVFVAGLVPILSILFFSGILVHSPEFGIVVHTSIYERKKGGIG